MVPNASVITPLTYNTEAATFPSETVSNHMPHPSGLPESTSNFRRVFQTSDEMKGEFVKFLKTIFYQLDEKKVLPLMEQLLNDPHKSDEEIYKELLQRINEVKKKVPILSQIWSLLVLKKGLGPQISELMQGFNKEKFHDYMEIYDRRYVNTIRKIAKLPLDGKVIAVCNTETVGFADCIQAGALLSSFPYKTHVPLNDDDCKDPFLEPKKTQKAIGAEVQDNSLDLIGCLGGLHHIPKERVKTFTQSMHSKLRPGGVILLREHNVTDNEGTGSAKLSKAQLKAIAAVVHTFVNASEGASWEIEGNEIREFKSLTDWTQFMGEHGFVAVSKKFHVLKDDPTENAMFAFVKQPQTLEELRQAISYRNDCTRPKEGTRATWIEWGNVRFSKKYAEYTQNHHAYAFDFIGHMRQHWTHFYYFVKESLKDKEVSLTHSIFCDAMLMNLFIVIGTTLQCGISSLTSLPSQAIARWKHGPNWRNVTNLTDMEKFEAKCMKQYSDDLDTVPFYLQNHLGKIKEVWKTLWNSQEHWSIKLNSTFSAISNTLGFFILGAVSVPIAAIYSQDAYKEPPTVKMLIKDPDDEISYVIEEWEKNKDQQLDESNKIEVVHTTADGYKLISVPRFRAFTKIFGYLEKQQNLEVLEIGSQKEISVDLLLKQETTIPDVNGARMVYEMESLQDTEKKRYVTYQVNVCALQHFQKVVGKENIHYIHE